VNVRDAVKTKTNVRVEISVENVAGCHQPSFHLRGLDDADDLMIGMTGGGQAINKAKDRFTKYL
jgi:vacuolar-type H+-ATPase subunit D/Vma8